MNFSWNSIFNRRRPNPQPAQARLAVSARVDDSPRLGTTDGWSSLSARPHDYDAARVQEIYANSLEAWRKNPIAWRIIAITTDYVVGDRLTIASGTPRLNRFIADFWRHPKNRIDLRLESMCDELARAGDLFVLLFRNPADGQSYIRFVTKDQVQSIQTAENDWETELSYTTLPPSGFLMGGAGGGSEPVTWLSPAHPQAADAPTIMLHYAVNRPLGALLGESDLTTLIPWLLRYSRMLEDRVRMHWAMRAFLWMVTVPANKVREKQEQYRLPPDSGALIVKDDSETWQAVAPQMQAADAQHDLSAVRGMIDAGSGYPPHWRGEAADANLATATAMQAPTERHLRRRQQYFTFILEDILYHAYQRAVQIGRARPLPSAEYSELFTAVVPDVSRTDNEALARSAREFAQGLTSLNDQLGGASALLRRRNLQLFMKFAGEPLSESQLDQMMTEIERSNHDRTLRSEDRS